MATLWYDPFFFFSSRRRHTRYIGDWSSDVCSSDLRPRLLVGFRTHEERHQRHVRIDLVIGKLLQPFGDGVVIGMHPGMRGVGADELEIGRASCRERV